MTTTTLIPAVTITLTADQAQEVYGLIWSHTCAQKNRLASMVERGEFAKAEKMVAELRKTQDIAATINGQYRAATGEYCRATA